MCSRLGKHLWIVLLPFGLAGCNITWGGSGQHQGGAGGDLHAVQHIIFMLQENRSFDSYFGHLNGYRTSKGLPADVDGTPADASNPSYDGSRQITPFHMRSMCSENLTPSWNESHVDWNRNDPLSPTPKMDGFVREAAGFARDTGLLDIEGLRAMGYYDASDLPFYYFTATQFATSDRWFSPLMTKTQPNRLASLAATSAGFIRAPDTTLSQKTIFHLLEAAGISWKVYTTSGTTYLSYFQPFASQHSEKIVPVEQYFRDLQADTLPAVALIETGTETEAGVDNTNLDEHPNNHIQLGAHYVARLMTALMQSNAWKSSVFILTYDEGGGLYDHVPPQPTVSPDGIKPILKPTDLQDDFTRTGFRVPLIVVSPFTRPGYVSHTVADYTAILKFIETRFGLPNLTQRDAAQPDMTEFFDFSGAPNLNPPSPPEQPTNGPCYKDHLP